MDLLFEKRNGIAYLTLNRPESRNSLSPELIVDLIDAWEEYKKDNSLRCAIVTGAGAESFCAGADLTKLIPLLTGARQPETDADKKIQKDPLIANKAILRDFDLFKPVIAAINGHAIAGGMEFLYSMDIRISCEQAKFGLQEAKWAIFPAGGSSVYLPQQIPYARAMEILLTGQLMSAQEMYEFGFLNRVVPAENVMEEAEKFAAIIAKNGPLAVSAIKQSVKTNMGVPVKEALNREIELALPVFMSEDAVEGPKAFKEKRDPVFKGK